MDLLPTDEQTEITDTIATVLADRFPLNLLDSQDGSIDADQWRQFGELGWFSLGLAEDQGGVGYGAAEEALLFRELGKALAPGPFLAQVVAAHLAAAAGTPAGIAAGENLAGLIGGEIIAGWAERTGENTWLLLHQPQADVLVASDRNGLRLVGPESFEGVETIPSLDPLTPLATARSEGGTVGDPSEGATATRAQVLLGASLAGIALATTEQSVEYGKVRHQFGQPVGGFQAVKHRCADMAARSEVAISQVYWAALCVDGSAADAPAHALAARVVANQAAISNAQVNVQNHGGIGFTWEHSAHRYVTRARLWGQLLGGLSGAQRDLLAQPTPS
jgi:alkylation response protein AidB-like acyl-CoA dehydrogenase